MYHDEAMDEAATSKPKVPLDQEWVVLAKKMLKGADPEKTLTWKTAEVSRWPPENKYMSVHVHGICM